MDWRKTLFGASMVLLAPALVWGQPARAWTRTVGQTMASNTLSRFVRTDSAGNTYALRLKTFRLTNDADGYGELVKYSAAGAVLWTSNLIGRGVGLAQPNGLALDASGNAFVCMTEDFATLGPTYTLTKVSAANGSKLWETTNVGVLSTGSALRTDGSGNVFLGGQGVAATDMRFGLTKYNGSNGALLWSKTIPRAAAGYSDFLTDMSVDASGHVAMVGTTRSSNFCLESPPTQILMQRINGSTGNTIWATTYTANATDQYYTVESGVDSTGNVFAGSWTQRTMGTAWVCTKRVAATGASSFNKVVTSTNPSLFELNEMTVDGTGGVTLMGDSFNLSSFALYLIHLNSTGGQVWTKSIPNRSVPSASANGSRLLLSIGSTALTVVASQSVPPNTCGVSRINLVNGANVWDKTYSPAGTANAIAAAVASNGDTVFVTSLVTSNNPKVYQGTTARMAAANGAPVFNVISSNAVVPTPDFASRIIADPFGNIYSTSASASRFVTEKVNSSGVLQWQNVFDSGAFGVESSPSTGAVTLVRDQLGNIIVSGTNHGSSCVQKINGTTGVTMWQRRLANSFGRNVALSSTGDVYVPVALPAQVMKLNGANGNTIWTAPVNGTGTYDVCDYVAVNSSNYVFAAGKTFDFQACPNQNLEKIMVSRLDPNTGAKVWLSQLGAPVAGFNDPCGLFPETTGNVQVAGTSAGATNSDFVAARMNGISGVVLWQTRHDYLGRSEHASAGVLDSSNNLLLTGTTSSTVLTDTWTAKINMSNGSRAWANLLSTPAGFKASSDIARDSLNNVYVGGLVVNGATISMFGQKMSSTGVTTWSAVSPAGALESPGTDVSVAVSPANRLHEFGSVSSAGVGLSQTSLFQFNP